MLNFIKVRKSYILEKFYSSSIIRISICSEMYYSEKFPSNRNEIPQFNIEILLHHQSWNLINSSLAKTDAIPNCENFI